MPLSQNTVVVVGGGAREDALVRQYFRSPHVDQVIAIPGNDGMERNRSEKKLRLYPYTKTTSVDEIVYACKGVAANLVHIAQDNAVEAGVSDALRRESFPVVGPSKAAGRIEWDKLWARQLMHRAGVLQPNFHGFTKPEDGIAFVESQDKKTQWVVKATGLAEGKGVILTNDAQETIAAIQTMARFGTAAATYLIEERLTGEEFSFFIASDGKAYTVLGSAQDNKTLLNNDKGPMTGGMGCNAPPLVMTHQLRDRIRKEIVERILAQMESERIPYQGDLYVGGMLLDGIRWGQIAVIECNARWGDPEAQVIVPGFVSDMYELGMSIANGTLASYELRTDGKTRVGVTAAVEDYPGDISRHKGKRIQGLERVTCEPGVSLYYGGVKKDVAGFLTVSGGRLATVVGEADDALEARRLAYEAIRKLSIDGAKLHWRTDIAHRDIARHFAALMHRRNRRS